MKMMKLTGTEVLKVPGREEVINNCLLNLNLLSSPQLRWRSARPPEGERLVKPRQVEGGKWGNM